MRPVLTALLVLSLAGAVACSRPETTAAGSSASEDPTRPLPSPMPEVVARVDGEPILFTQIVPMARREIDADDEGHEEAGRNRAVRRALDRYIDRELLFEEARARGIRADQHALDWAYDQARKDHPDDESWKAFLAESGLDPPSLKTEMRIQQTVNALLDAEAGGPVTDEEARRAYEAHPEDFVAPGDSRPPFDDVRDQVKRHLRQQQIDTARDRLVAELRARAHIETFL